MSTTSSSTSSDTRSGGHSQAATYFTPHELDADKASPIVLTQLSGRRESARTSPGRPGLWGGSGGGRSAAGGRLSDPSCHPGSSDDGAARRLKVIVSAALA